MKFHFIINISLENIKTIWVAERIYTSEIEHVFFAAFIPRTIGNLVPFNEKPFIPIPYIWRTVRMQYRN